MDTGEPTDLVLLTAGRKGDQGALETLIERYQRPLYSFILRMTGPDDAADVFQETWARAIRALPRFDDRKLLSWLFRIARNLAVDRARRAGRFVSLEGDSREEQYASPLTTPDRDAADRDLAAHIRRAVDGLPAEQREVFLMRTEGNMPFKEIADVQGVSINTALARMQYALEKLRVALDACRAEKDGLP